MFVICNLQFVNMPGYAMIEICIQQLRQPNMLKKIIQRSLSRYLFSAQPKSIQARKKYSQSITLSRAVMNLYKLSPKQASNVFITPNATVIGQVYFGKNINVGHGTVIRGDINAVFLHNGISIGDNCVIHTAACLPSGLPAVVSIMNFSVISSGCTLYSCSIRDRVFVGANSVILEGAIIESGATILPNSVVPPGRVVPAGQVWGGNPIKFIRYARDQQKFVTKKYTQVMSEAYTDYKSEFLARPHGYLYKPSDPENDKVRTHDLIKPERELENDGIYDPENPTL